MPIIHSFPDNLWDEEEALTTNLSPHTHSILGRHNLNGMDIRCPHYSALHWSAEMLSSSSPNQPLFEKCCLQGKIRLPSLLTPPPEIQALYDINDVQSKSFRSHTQLYNVANAFMSLGVQMDDRLLPGRGLTTFTIHGELRHRTCVLQPSDGQDPVYAQLYIHDSIHALDYCTRRNPQLRTDVLQAIQDALSQYNSFTEKF